MLGTDHATVMPQQPVWTLFFGVLLVMFEPPKYERGLILSIRPEALQLRLADFLLDVTQSLRASTTNSALH